MTTARGIDFYEDWVASNIFGRPSQRENVDKLGAKLIADANTAGLTLQDMDIDETRLRQELLEVIVHLIEPGTPGD